MEFFKVWIMSLCGATVITTITKLLLSESNVKKSVDIFCAIFILFYTIVPMNSLVGTDYKSNVTEEYNVDIKLEDGYKKIISKAINNVCDKLNVEILSLDIDSYLDDNNVLIVNKIVIDVDQNDLISEIRETIKSESGLEVEVI